MENSLPCGGKAMPDLPVSVLLAKDIRLKNSVEVIAGNAVHKSKFAEKTRTSARSAQVHQKAELSFLIDVRAKMQAGKGAGYARWAKVFNLKQMAKAMMFMEGAWNQELCRAERKSR